MTKETRANLIFLTVIVVLTAPGLILFVIKHLDRPARGLEPPPVRTRFAYMDRTPQIAGLSRVTPPATGRFVANVTRQVLSMQSGLQSLVGAGRFDAVMSEQLYFQVVAVGASKGIYRVALIGWTEKLAPLPTLYTITGARGQATVPGSLVAYESRNMPLEIRKELQDYGYILPPSGVLWMIVEFPGEAPVERCAIEYRMDDQVIRDAIDFAPAAAAATRPSLVP